MERTYIGVGLASKGFAKWGECFHGRMGLGLMDGVGTLVELTKSKMSTWLLVKSSPLL